MNEFQDNNRLASDGIELIIESIFVENDHRRHMSINLETGLWQCFKSGERGNFFKLYSKVKGVSYKHVYEQFMFNAFIEGREEEPDKIEITGKVSQEDLDCFTPLNLEILYDNFIMNEACILIQERKLQNFKFLASDCGRYENRIIIPYYDDRNRMFFFQARALKGQQPKYLNCKSIKSSWILYPFDYESTQPLYITEGAFDCMALQAVGVNATSTISCRVSNIQMEQLSHYRGPLVVAYDNDEAGRKGLRSFLKLACKYKIRNIDYVVVPPKVKDWNSAFVRWGATEVASLLRQRRELNSCTAIGL